MYSTLDVTKTWRAHTQARTHAGRRITVTSCYTPQVGSNLEQQLHPSIRHLSRNVYVNNYLQAQTYIHTSAYVNKGIGGPQCSKRMTLIRRPPSPGLRSKPKASKLESKLRGAYAGLTRSLRGQASYAGLIFEGF